MNILVIFTGGTICSSVNDGYINTNETGKDRLIQEYKKLHASDTEHIYFTTETPYYILSENLNGSHINKLADCIDKAVLGTEHDGIIVTHGTDTQQYMSAALSYLFPNLQIPVVLVSSNYILDDDRANGIANFSAAVDFIKECSNCQQTVHHGVYVAYKNENEAAVIHYGTRLLPHMPYSDRLYSIEQNSHSCNKQIDIYNYLSGHPRYTEASPVMYIRPVPGQQYTDVPGYVRAILLDSFHSGTLCTRDASFQNMLLDAAKREIPIFLTGAEDRTGYESTRIYKDLSISVLPKASPVSMYMKLWLLVSMSCETISDCMGTPVCHDIVI
ncbi:MAG: asparaginase domain-containing protein [Muribaculaceae bacterium]|nr:asparaginase domain-containing protein [Muribaculaceae bacterium]MCM1398967.1 asparaginase domain-containing protein [Clostridium sp.]MCM1458825.1 asparaginase domain-containing protein [Bacteroides sp.]